MFYTKCNKNNTPIIGISFSNKEYSTSGKLAVYLKRARFNSKEFIDKHNLAGKGFSFIWNSFEKKFITGKITRRKT